MKSNSKPFVSIVTPVYNAEQYLTDCIESVLKQSYKNWEYVIVNNRSEDGSLRIAQDYASKNNKIRIYNNQKFLSQINSLNYTMRQISSGSKYCKVVHSDDWIFPECIERMVEIAEKYPTAGIVSSYRLDENKVNLDGLPNTDNFFEGRFICRKNLLDGLYVFGSPSSILIRSDLIRRHYNFYKGNHPHADKEICFEILKDSGFGFVHQVLTYTRRHNESVTAKNKRLYTHNIGKLKILKKYGPIYLSKKEYQNKLKGMIDFLYIFLAKNMLKNKNRDLLNYYKLELKNIGHPVSNSKLMVAIFFEILNLKKTLKIIKKYYIKFA